MGRIKIIYASYRLKEDTIMNHLNNFYNLNPQIPIYRRPDIIHVAGKYVILRIKEGMSIKKPDGSNHDTKKGKFHIFNTNPDRQAIVWTLNELQKKATTSNHINFNYSEIINKISES